MASGVAPHGVEFVSEKPPNPDLTNSQSDISNRPRSVPGNRRRVPPLSRDSGVSSIELIQSPDIRDTWELNSGEPEAPVDITTDRQEYSEEELLDITFDACRTTSRGEVLSSAIMDYLQTMTSQSPNQDRLSTLKCLLDPNSRNPPVSRDTFHSTMREWIAQCAQDGNYGDENRVSMTEASRGAKKATDISSPEHTTAFPEEEPCYCNTRELLSTVAELQHAHCRLNKQNGSLLRTVSQCEDTNLQLSIEVTELRAKLSSAQRAAVRARSLGDDLEEAKRSSREAQERASQAHSSCTILTNEMECLKVHIRMLEDKVIHVQNARDSQNEEITLERTCAEESVNKLRKVNAEMRAELEESFAMMGLQDREITKRDFLMEKMKNSHLDNHRIIKGLQSELIRLQEHSQQIIISFERHFPSSQRLLMSRRAPPNYCSLQTEIQDMQELRATADEVSSPVCEGPFLHLQQEDIQHIIQRIKSAELGHLHYTSYSERDSVSGYGSEPSEGPLPNSQQQQARIKKQLVNMLRELELQRALGEEREAKVEEPPCRAHRHTQTPDWSPILAHTPAPEARKVALVNWWKALRTEGGESKHKAIKESPQSSLALAETKAKLQQAEQAIAEMRGQVCHLEAALKSAWEDVTVGQTSRPSKVGVSQTDQETNTVTEGTHWAGQEVATEPRDVAVVTQPLEDLDGLASEQRGQAQDRVTADGLLSSLRRMEAMVGGALENAELVRQGERRVSQVKDRMEAIAKTMEETLKRTADTNSQLSRLEAQIMEQPFTQLPGLLAPADQGSDVTSAPARPDVEVQRTDRPSNPSPPAETSVHTPPWPHTNGDICLASREDSSNSSWSFDNPETLLTVEDQRNPLCSSPVVPNPWKTNGAAAPEAASLASVSENTYTSPVLTPSLVQPPLCASLLTVPPETRSQSAGNRRTTGNPEENVAGSQNPIIIDCCPSEPADHGIGQDSSLNDFVSGQNTEEVGAKHHSEPKGCEQGYPLNRGSSECHQGTQSETCGRSQTSEHSRGVFADRNQEGSGQSLQSSFCWGTDPSDECSPAHSSISQDLFVFPRTRSRPGQPPSMPTLPEEEEDSPEELDSSSSSPSTYAPGEAKAVAMTAPTIVFPKQATVIHQDGRPLEQARPHSPRARSARISASSAGPITTVDGTGNVIDLLKDKLPELHLSAEERQKNLELLEEAKKVSDRFLTRRGRRSTCSLSDSPTGLSPIPTPSSSPVPSRSSSITVAPLIAEVSYVTAQSISQRLEVPSVREQQEDPTPGQEGLRRLADWKPNEKRKVSSGTLAPRHSGPPPSKEHGGGQKENCDPRGPRKGEEGGAAPGRGTNQAPATGVAKPVPRPPTQQAPCTAEIKTIGAFPPLMRAVSWDTVGTLNARNSPPNFSPPAEEVFSFPDPLCDGPLKSSGYKDFPAQPVNVQKLSKLREEHKLMRNQSLGSSKLGDLSETAEQDRGPPLHSPIDEEMKEKMDSMPNISDVMLRKLKLHRGLPGCAPPLTEKEVENAFVQLSLAFRNDNYTLETRLKQSERERNLVEENTEKELEEFKGSLKSTAPQWQNMEQREAYQSLIETVAVLHRLATRLSSKAEVVGAVRQEKRMSKATEVMMQYVENLKRTYEKDHAELMEFKKLANQNSNRCYGGSIDTGDDGVPRPSRSMSLTLGKALPRRRVSVAVVPKFNLLNIPGQTPAIAGPGPGQNFPTGANHGPGPAGGPVPGSGLPVLCEAVVLKSNGSEAAHPAGTESGKSGPSEQERDPSASVAKPPVVNLEEMRAQIAAELKAKIEEECYSKGFEEGLKKKKELQELKEEEERAEERLLESEREDEESGKQIQPSSKIKEVLMVLDRLCPKILRRHQLLWVIPAMLLALFLLLNIFTHFGSSDNDSHGDMSADKSTVQGKKKLFGVNVVQPKNPAPE